MNSFLGKEKLTGVRLESVEGRNRFDLLVDGVFLEVGLTPNSDPLKGLVELNEFGEVPIKQDNSTDVKGLFAAGDVTDVEEKQISIAVGHGALAAFARARSGETSLSNQSLLLKSSAPTWNNYNERIHSYSPKDTRINKGLPIL